MERAKKYNNKLFLSAGLVKMSFLCLAICTISAEEASRASSLVVLFHITIPALPVVPVLPASLWRYAGKGRDALWYTPNLASYIRGLPLQRFDP